MATIKHFITSRGGTLLAGIGNFLFVAQRSSRKLAICRLVRDEFVIVETVPSARKMNDRQDFVDCVKLIPAAVITKCKERPGCITPATFAKYIDQYRELNPNASVFDLCNKFFNDGYFYGRKRDKIAKWDIPTHDWRYKRNPFSKTKKIK